MMKEEGREEGGGGGRGEARTLRGGREARPPGHPLLKTAQHGRGFAVNTS